MKAGEDLQVDNGNVGLDNGNVGHMLTTNQTPHIQTMEENNENVNLGKGS